MDCMLGKKKLSGQLVLVHKPHVTDRVVRKPNTDFEELPLLNFFCPKSAYVEVVRKFYVMKFFLLAQQEKTNLLRHDKQFSILCPFYVHTFPSILLSS